MTLMVLYNVINEYNRIDEGKQNYSLLNSS